MGKLFVISAPSGTGKTSLIHATLEDENAEKTKLGISCTTRKKRAQEKNNESYFFVSNEEFEEKIKNNEFLEYAEVFGNFYGTPKEWVLDCLSKKENVILELDIQGALQVKETFPETKTVFIIPPSYSDLSSRLEKRAQDTEKEIKRRLMEAKKEIFIGQRFDQIIVNDDFEIALHDLKQFIFSGDALSPERKSITDDSLNLLLD
ncbi:guanylate kinase [Gammaproteobacteria bacterium]|nr:guanylate kinase [Gammaproteobacteria bacterium]